MLVKFVVKNFLSFKDEQEITFARPSNRSRRQIDNSLYKFYRDKRLQRLVNSIAIYGANGAGKSNLLIGLRSLKKFIEESHKYTVESDLDYIIPFEFQDTKDENIELTVDFINKEKSIYYKYNVSFFSKNNKVAHESIEISKVSKDVIYPLEVVFEREKNTIVKYDENLDKLINEFKPKNFEYKSVISMFNNSINDEYFEEELRSDAYKHIEEVYKFLSEKINIISKSKSEDDIAERLLEDTSFKEELLRAFNDLDFFIKDFEIKDITDEFVAGVIKSLSDEALPKDIKNKFMMQLKSQKKYSIKPIYFVDNNQYPLNFNMESSGTKKFISDFIEIYDALTKGELVIFDEIEDSYHHLLQEYLVNLFFYGNDNDSQILFTTHNTKLLVDISFSKEQVYFVERDRKEMASKVYSLIDFPEVSIENHNWEKLYLEGRLGAVPEVFK